MREIKFRGKRVDNGDWVYGMLCRTFEHDKLENGYGIQVADEFEMKVYPVDPNTVGQYTGLEDKNGTEIYEGDIVKHHDDITSKVIYNSSHCAFIILDITGNRRKGQCDHLGIYDSLWIEVIGNIHDNPEGLNNDNKS